MTDIAKTKADFEKIIKDAQEGIKRLTEKDWESKVAPGAVFKENNGYPYIFVLSGYGNQVHLGVISSQKNRYSSAAPLCNQMCDFKYGTVEDCIKFLRTRDKLEYVGQVSGVLVNGVEIK